MRAVVLGSEGCLGKALCVELKNRGYEVIEIDKNPAAPYCFNVRGAAILRFLHNTDFVFNVSGSYSGIYLTDYSNNYKASKNLMTRILVNRIKTKVLFVGSIAEYGDLARNGPKEDNIKFANNKTVNGRIKALQSELIMDFNHRCPLLDFRIARISNIFSEELSQFLIIGKIVEKLRLFKKTGQIEEKIQLGNLHLLRNYIDIKDVVNALILIMEKGTKGIYNVGTNTQYCVKDVVLYLVKKYGFKMKDVITYEPNHCFNDNRSYMNTEKLQNLGFVVKYPLPFLEYTNKFSNKGEI